MLILFDQDTPVPLRTFLAEHTVKTAAQQEWSTLSNGALLRAAEAEGFDLLLTTDKNLPFQQSARPQDCHCGAGKSAMAGSATVR